MTEPNHSFNDVPALVEERRRYDAWLAALEARRESTAVHVFDRVKADYQARLQRVDEQLVAHRQAIEEERTSSQTRLSLIAADEQLHRDERAELELRSHVGELAGAEADAAFHAVDETIRQLVEQKNAVSGSHRRAGRVAQLQARRRCTACARSGAGRGERDGRSSGDQGRHGRDARRHVRRDGVPERSRGRGGAPRGGDRASAKAERSGGRASAGCGAAGRGGASRRAARCRRPNCRPSGCCPSCRCAAGQRPIVVAPPAAAPPPSSQPWATANGGPQSTGAPNRAGNVIGAGPGSGIVRSPEIGEPPRAPLGPRRSATGTAPGPAAGGMRRDEPAESLLAGMDNPPRRGAARCAARRECAVEHADRVAGNGRR